MAKKAEQPKRLRITWMRSAIGYSVRHKATMKALGFHRLHETIEHVDSLSLRGMLSKVNHLVTIEEL
ncbi:MAG TPA: 50S ribosomal protein L30 [Anaerolineaceae bacterium]|nr:50S ribosomal protein L30 [Anaerolineaceae bacterium]